MFAKFFVFLAVTAIANAGVIANVPYASAALVAPVPPAAYAVAPYASSYSAHAVNHAVAAPVVGAAPLVAAPAPFAAPAPYVAAPAPFAAPAPYVASPYYV